MKIETNLIKLYCDYFFKTFYQVFKKILTFFGPGILKRMFLVFPFLVEMLVQPWFTLFYHEIIFAISFKLDEFLLLSNLSSLKSVK